jgi:ubiquinone/menaquinone biosynthesis C-methylase UbiE
LNTVKAAYDSVAKEYAGRFFHELAAKPLDQKLLDMFSERVAQAGRVCEVGCGPGEVAAYLARVGVHVYGIDISEKMIDVARRLSPAIHFEQGDMLSLQADDNSLAGIVGLYAIVNLSKPEVESAFAEFYRTLQPAAPLLLSFHVGDEILHVTDFLGKPASLDFIFYPVEIIGLCLNEQDFT